MSFTKGQWWVLVSNLLIVLGFGYYYLQSANYEFLAYVGTIIVVIGVLLGTIRYTKFPTYLLFAVTIWGLLHMLGGSLMTPDGVLYAYRIFPLFDGGGDFYILKMDQVIHAYLYGVVALMFFYLLKNLLKVRDHVFLVSLVAIFAATGVGVLNEIVEFWAAINIPDNGVGGYENTVLDLIFNFLGSVVAILGVGLFSYIKNRF